MPDIFLSYRRRDSASATGRLADRLVEHFGPERVFHDHASILAGEDFAAAIRRAINLSTVVLAVIGPDWLEARDEHGTRRLDDPNDFVRLEIADALDAGLPVLPVLVEGAAMPTAAQLPAVLADFARCQAVELSESRWRYDSDRLIALLQSRYAIESEQPPLLSDPDEKLVLSWPGRLALDLLELATHPTRLIGRRQTGRAIDHLRAFAFLVVCLALGNTLLLLGLDRYLTLREAGDFVGFQLFAGVLELFVVTLVSVALTVAWRLVGSRVEFRQITLIMAFIGGGAVLGSAVGWLVWSLGLMLSDPTLIGRATELLAGRTAGAPATLSERAALVGNMVQAAAQGPARAAMVFATLVWAGTLLWTAIAWGSFRLSFGASRLRAAGATLLCAGLLGAVLALSVWLAG
ncbi:MAG: toll/interleukin-1 receptor domain-containing protein [Piscinibacter sp.]|uniref:toll/interleukin-1 receptor domain-containing protein n=1 Tax=Piscinibacter sp. TaxID=1903157 RepID=UPI00258B2851|nr:toll/interleukin-1 receptor domain-containing protein [Piscinibacter sp.]MCW5665536.1 toll/interleukin-1 receptor domain-containing protein [Piscinibacter sp.]